MKCCVMARLSGYARGRIGQHLIRLTLVALLASPSLAKAQRPTPIAWTDTRETARYLGSTGMLRNQTTNPNAESGSIPTGALGGLIGGVAGGVFGYTFEKMLCDTSRCSATRPVLIGAVLGALLGAGLEWLIRGA